MNLKETEYVKGTNELQLHCPICNFEYTHLKEVKTNLNKENRLEVILSFECEEQHVFEHRIHNHKGYTLITNGKEKF
ncbi:MAG TPA: hypothetical protein VLZ75_05820 [Chitinophagales bacterium]|nr:hypothetical protein [Chitinophagales bacterium]